MITFALDQSYRYIAFNSQHKDTMQSIWGKEITLGLNMLGVIGDHSDHNAAKKCFDRALAGECFTLEEAYGDERLTRQYWQNHYAPIYSAEGNVVGVTCFVLNITERKRLEEAIAAREQEFRSLAESSPDFIIRVNRDLRIRYLNANMVKFLELGSAQEIIGRQSIEIWPDGRFNEIDAAREHVVTTGEMLSIEVTVPTAEEAI